MGSKGQGAGRTGILGCLLLLCLWGAPPGWAWVEDQRFQSGPQRTRLLELYTSQGCSSCPPADRWINQLEKDPGLWREFVPVALHVQYWDYLGWRDSFATPSLTRRQYRHHREGNIAIVATPMFLLDGRRWSGWRILRRRPPRAAQEPAGLLSTALHEGRAEVRYQPPPNAPRQDALQLYYVVLGFGQRTAVSAGENRNRVLQQEFVALEDGVHRSATAAWQFLLERPRIPARRYALALWVSPPDRLLPLQAAGAWLQPSNTQPPRD